MTNRKNQSVPQKGFGQVQTRKQDFDKIPSQILVYTYKFFGMLNLNISRGHFDYFSHF